MAAQPDRQPTPLGAEIAKLRKQRGWSEDTLARHAGLSGSFIHMLESGDRGKRIGRDAVIALAQGFGLDGRGRDRLLQLANHYVAEASDGTRLSFADFMKGDPWLRSDQKQRLIDLYETFTGRKAAEP